MTSCCRASRRCLCTAAPRVCLSQSTVLLMAKKDNSRALGLCRYSHCTGRHAGGHLQPGEAGHRRAVWSLYLGPSKREIMKMAFLFLSHGLVSPPCPGVSRVSSHTDSDPSRLAPVPVIDIQCLLHVASLYSSVLLLVSGHSSD